MSHKNGKISAHMQPLPTARVWVTFNHLLALTFESIRSPSPSLFPGYPSPGAEIWKKSCRGVFCEGMNCSVASRGAQGEWANPARGQGSVCRESRPVRLSYPRLGPLGTNQGPAMPMRPQNVVKMMTGRAKEWAVMAGCTMLRWGTGSNGGLSKQVHVRAEGSEHAQRDPSRGGPGPRESAALAHL